MFIRDPILKVVRFSLSIDHHGLGSSYKDWGKVLAENIVAVESI